MSNPIIIHVTGDENQRRAKVEIALAIGHALRKLGYETSSDEDPILVETATKSFGELEVQRDRTGTTGSPAVPVSIKSRRPLSESRPTPKPKRRK